MVDIEVLASGKTSGAPESKQRIHSLFLIQSYCEGKKEWKGDPVHLPYLWGDMDGV